MTLGTSTLRRIAERLDRQAAARELRGTRRGTRQAWHLRQLADAHRRKAERAEGET